MREVQNKWQTIKMNDDIWAKLIYFEQNRRLTKAYVSTPVLTIDGSTSGLDGFRIGLSGIDNAYRSLDSMSSLRSIGQGIKLKIDGDGNILVRRMAPTTGSNSSSQQCSIWVKEWPPNCDSQSDNFALPSSPSSLSDSYMSAGSTSSSSSSPSSSMMASSFNENWNIKKLQFTTINGDDNDGQHLYQSYKLFDMKKFRLQLEKQKRLMQLQLQTQQMSNVNFMTANKQLNRQSPIQIDWRQCVTIISFVRNTIPPNLTGNQLTKQLIVEDRLNKIPARILQEPCWIMLINIIAIDMLKSLLCDNNALQMAARHGKQSIVRGPTNNAINSTAAAAAAANALHGHKSMPGQQQQQQQRKSRRPPLNQSSLNISMTKHKYDSFIDPYSHSASSTFGQGQQSDQNTKLLPLSLRQQRQQNKFVLGSNNFNSNINNYNDSSINIHNTNGKLKSSSSVASLHPTRSANSSSINTSSTGNKLSTSSSGTQLSDYLLFPTGNIINYFSNRRNKNAAAAAAAAAANVKAAGNGSMNGRGQHKSSSGNLFSFRTSNFSSSTTKTSNKNLSLLSSTDTNKQESSTTQTKSSTITTNTENNINSNLSKKTSRNVEQQRKQQQQIDQIYSKSDYITFDNNYTNRNIVTKQTGGYNINNGRSDNSQHLQQQHQPYHSTSQQDIMDYPDYYMDDYMDDHARGFDNYQLDDDDAIYTTFTGKYLYENKAKQRSRLDEAIYSPTTMIDEPSIDYYDEDTGRQGQQKQSDYATRASLRKLKSQSSMFLSGNQHMSDGSSSRHKSPLQLNQNMPYDQLRAPSSIKINFDNEGDEFYNDEEEDDEQEENIYGLGNGCGIDTINKEKKNKNTQDLSMRSRQALSAFNRKANEWSKLAKRFAITNNKTPTASTTTTTTTTSPSSSASSVLEKTKNGNKSLKSGSETSAAATDSKMAVKRSDKITLTSAGSTNKQAQKKISRSSIVSSASSSSGCPENDDYFLSQSSMSSSSTSSDQQSKSVTAGTTTNNSSSQLASSSGIVCLGSTSDDYCIDSNNTNNSSSGPISDGPQQNHAQHNIGDSSMGLASSRTRLSRRAATSDRSSGSVIDPSRMTRRRSVSRNRYNNIKLLDNVVKNALEAACDHNKQQLMTQCDCPECDLILMEQQQMAPELQTEEMYQNHLHQHNHLSASRLRPTQLIQDYTNCDCCCDCFLDENDDDESVVVDSHVHNHGHISGMVGAHLKSSSLIEDVEDNCTLHESAAESMMKAADGINMIASEQQHQKQKVVSA